MIVPLFLLLSFDVLSIQVHMIFYYNSKQVVCSNIPIYTFIH